MDFFLEIFFGEIYVLVNYWLKTKIIKQKR